MPELPTRESLHQFIADVEAESDGVIRSERSYGTAKEALLTGHAVAAAPLLDPAARGKATQIFNTMLTLYTQYAATNRRPAP